LEALEVLFLDGENLSEIEKYYVGLLERMGFRPLTQVRVSVLECRVVHDLGITGDDFVEFLAEIRLWKTPIGEVPVRFIPSEVSRDSYLVSMARSKLALRFPFIAKYYVNRIASPPLKLGDMHSMLFTAYSPEAK
jgi:hypothetical protein